MTERSLNIKNKLGIHARPAALFVETSSAYVSDITVIKDGMEINGKSIMGVLMLAAEYGSQLLLRADGPDEEELLDALSELINNKFTED